jgi:hypothetical protein
MCQLTNHALIFTGLLFIGGGICCLLSVIFRENPDEKALTMEDYEYTVKVSEKNRMLNDETNAVNVNENNRMLNDETNAVKVNEKTTMLNDETSTVKVNESNQEEHNCRKISTQSRISSCRSELK